MGGDFGPRVTVSASLDALKRHPQLVILLVGDQEQISPCLKRVKSSVSSRLKVLHTESVIRNEDKPSYALRHLRESSMFMALQAVADGQAQACVSAGNTGALMAIGRHVIRTLPGVDRPAFISAIPAVKGHSYMLDLGANVDCSAEHLLQFAVMGSILAQWVDGIEQPKVGLLNIGAEEIKGNEQVREASRLIEAQDELNYIGFIEGDDLFSGRADVIVCDGFVGNIALKSSEGLARLIGRKVRASFRGSLYRRVLAMLARPALARLQHQLDPSRRNGASLLGLQGIVVKSHGAANRKCFGHALDEAVAEARMALPQKISEQIRHHLADSGRC